MKTTRQYGDLVLPAGLLFFLSIDESQVGSVFEIKDAM